jgi:hypothetical protein
MRRTSDAADVPAPPARRRERVIVMASLACSRAVLVEGCLTNADVRVFNSLNQPLGGARCNRQARAHVELSVALNEGERIFARQSMNGVWSEQSGLRTVEPLEGGIPMPRIVFAWECGERIGASVLTSGLDTEAQLERTHAVIGTATPTPYFVGSSRVWGEWYWPIPHNSTPQGTNDRVRVRQTYCPGTAAERQGPYSDWFQVESYSGPLPNLQISYHVGTEEFTAQDALVGARLDIDVDGDRWSRRAWSTGLIVPAGQVLTSNSRVSAIQSLCPGSESREAEVEIIPEEDFEQWLLEPTIGTPICPGGRYVSIQAATNGGYVQVSHNGVHVATVGGSTDPVQVDLGSRIELQDGDQISAYQAQPGDRQGQLNSPIGYAYVDGSEQSFTVTEQTVSFDWTTGQPIEGFSRAGRGPKFVLV